MATVSVVCPKGHVILNGPVVDCMLDVLSATHPTHPLSLVCASCGKLDWNAVTRDRACNLLKHHKDVTRYLLTVGLFTAPTNAFGLAALSATAEDTVHTPAAPVQTTPGSHTAGSHTASTPVQTDVADDWVTLQGLNAIREGKYTSTSYAVHSMIMRQLRQALEGGYDGVTISAKSLREVSGVEGWYVHNWQRFRTEYLARMSSRYIVVMTDKLTKTEPEDTARAIGISLAAIAL